MALSKIFKFFTISDDDGAYIEKPLPFLGKKTKPTDNGQSQDDNEQGDIAPNVDTVPPPTSPKKEKEPHNLMLLYDLFFAANLTAFSNIHDTVTVERLVAYIGYFVVLWLLWLNVMLFDVRFIVDSILERILRAVHLGAMVGVSVVAPLYNPADQIRETFQAFSVVLMISRATLAIQYALAIQYKPTSYRKGLIIVSLCHAAAAIVYLGVTFRFTDSRNSRVFITWYIVGFVEVVLNFSLSIMFKDLKFEEKTLTDRMKMTTLLILGEGVIVVAEHVSTVVDNENSWNSETIGVLTATVALIYVIFQIYFDWAWPAKELWKGPFLWTLLHLPFHLALVFIMEGVTQFIVWWKIVELIHYVTIRFDEAFVQAEADTGSSIAVSMAEHLNSTMHAIWEQYPPELLVTKFHADTLLEEIRDMDSTYWETDFPSIDSMGDNPSYQAFVEDFRGLLVTVINSIFQNFNIEEIEDSGWQDHPSTYEEHAFQDVSERFELVYIYVFCLAGVALILMAILHILSRPMAKSTRMQKIVIGINITLGIGLALLASMSRYDAHTQFTTTPWIIPSIFIVFLIALILIHTTRWHASKDKNKEY